LAPWKPKQRWRGNPSRVRLEQFVARAAAVVPEGALVLDAGAGEQTYAPLFAHAHYESADFEQVGKEYAKATYTCDLADIPVEDGRFDFVLFSQVLEHIPEPSLVLRELHRVLKPGGTLWLSTPLFYEEHEQPYDFFRYTQFGLRHLLEGAAFSIERIEWLEGYFATLSYQAKTMRRHLPHGAGAYGNGIEGTLLAACALPAIVLAELASRIFARLEMRHQITSSGHPKNYAVTARRSL
jgi:SAM-dependent methyltransferase